MPKNNDVVYILGDNLKTDELRYSLRSIEKNLPHRLVWFVGHIPDGFTPDRAIRHQQGGGNKWERIRSSMLRIAQEPELSPEFFLFNDDFFVMKQQRGKFVNFADKTLTWRIEELREVFPWLNHYGRTLVKARDELKIKGKTEVNFEVHMPMIFDKALVPTVLSCSSPQMRSIYGNMNGIPYKQHDDVKVYDLDVVPDDPDYLSTNDETFTKGAVGEYIRNQFPEASRFEVTL